MNIVVRPLAQRDLDEIWDYTIERWGIDQANRYILEIRRAIDGLPGSASRHSDASHLHPGLRKAKAGAHLVYFFGGGSIEVVRILHSRRDADALL